MAAIATNEIYRWSYPGSVAIHRIFSSTDCSDLNRLHSAQRIRRGSRMNDLEERHFAEALINLEQLNQIQIAV